MLKVLVGITGKLGCPCWSYWFTASCCRYYFELVNWLFGLPLLLKKGLHLMLYTLRDITWLLYDFVLCCWLYELCLQTRSVWPIFIDLLQTGWPLIVFRFLLCDRNWAVSLVFFSCFSCFIVILSFIFSLDLDKLVSRQKVLVLRLYMLVV